MTRQHRPCSFRRPLLAWVGVAVSAVAGCTKVPLIDIEVGFSRADTTWFAEEDTLFVFYELSAEQGLSDDSVLEITYQTDRERLDWTDVSTLPTVHTHVPVDCGPQAMCGSTSLAVSAPPRDVRLRLRYHRDGPLALEPETLYNAVGEGLPHDHRSYVVYGVFDETNTRVQWRGRHQFPTVRNEEASELGLRRDLTVDQATSGRSPGDPFDNPYLYGIDCTGTREDAELGAVSTQQRAVFAPGELPVSQSADTGVCAQATTTDANGTFTTWAHARKNPETMPAFPVLRSPVTDARELRFYLAPCSGPINAEHAEFQQDRLLFPGDIRTTCTDDWDSPAFIDRLAAIFSAAVEDARPSGDDMVLSIALQRDDPGVARAVEEALARVVPEERHRSSPRLAGAFVFDSDVRDLALSESIPVTLWCPTAFPSDEADVVSTAALTCAIAPDDTDFELGPLSFGQLPVLPSRERYLDFIRTYSERQAGEVSALSFRTPRFATTSDHVDLGDFGVVTFLNGEQVPAEPSDAFSYCPPRQVKPVVFRTDFMRSEDFLELVSELCRTGELPESFCETAELGVLPLELLPELHNTFPYVDYELGLFWDFPFLLRMTYEAYAAGSVSAIALSVPFGLSQTGEQYLGSQFWLSEEVDLSTVLTQCTRFCDHPTFDSAGVYHVTDPFRSTYQTSCHLPSYPELDEGGFPLDP